MAKKKRFISLLLCMAILFQSVAVNTTDVEAIDISGYNSVYYHTIKEGETMEVSFKDSEGNYVGEWKSDNPKVATVTKTGTIKGISVGNAMIYNQSSSNYKVGHYITVEKANVQLNQTNLSLYVGGQYTLKLSDTYGTVTWTSKDTKVATVQNGIITAKKVGTTKITATYNGKTYTCTVTVKEKPVKISKAKATLTAGEKLTLSLSNTTGKIVWSSSNKKVATVSGKGVVTAKKKGKVTITAKYKKKKYKCKITVKAKKISTYAFRKSALLEKGNQIKLKIKKAKASKVKWKSKNKKVAAVKKGVITAKKAGTTTITAKYGKKNYKCNVRVYAMKKLGTKTVSESANSATISNVKVSFDPAMLDKNATVTLKKVSGLPKLNGVAMNTYDFSLSGAKVNEDNVAEIEIPQKVGSKEVPVAAYFNEKTGAWEQETCTYADGKISILVNHFSTYGVGTVKDSDNINILDIGTTMAELWRYWTPALKAADGGMKAVEAVADALKSKEPTKACITLGWDALNEQFDYAVNWGANLYTSLSIDDDLSRGLGENTALLGSIGFLLSYVNAIRYTCEGEHAMAASSVMNGYIGAVSSYAAQWVGTAAMSAGCFAATIITAALGKGYSDMLSANEEKWYRVYHLYYEKEGKRKLRDWRDILKPIFESGKSQVWVENAVEEAVDDYVNVLWNDTELFSYYFSEGAKSAWGLSGGINDTLKTKISEQYKNELMNDNIKRVCEWYTKKLQRDAQTKQDEKTKQVAEILNKAYTISFYDGSVKKGKNSALKGWMVRWKNIPSKIKDKQNLKIKLDKSGKGSTQYTRYAAINYKIKAEVEIVSPSGKVVETRNYKIKSATTKINLMSSAVKTYIKNNTVKLNKTKLSIQVGKKSTLKLLNLSKKVKVKWKSSNRKVATVTKKGVVKGRKKGTAKINAICKKKKYTCTVTVTGNNMMWRFSGTQIYQPSDAKRYDYEGYGYDNGNKYVDRTYYQTCSASDGKFDYRSKIEKWIDDSSEHSGTCTGEYYNQTISYTKPKATYKPGEKIEVTFTGTTETSKYLCFSRREHFAEIMLAGSVNPSNPENPSKMDEIGAKTRGGYFIAINKAKETITDSITAPVNIKLSTGTTEDSISVGGGKATTRKLKKGDVFYVYVVSVGVYNVTCGVIMYKYVYR